MPRAHLRDSISCLAALDITFMIQYKFSYSLQINTSYFPVRALPCQVLLLYMSIQCNFYNFHTFRDTRVIVIYQFQSTVSS